MERIQKALEQATRERDGGQKPGSKPATTESGIYRVEYSQTKIVDVPESVFRENRIISAIPEHQYKDAYRMLRTRVLQQLQGNNWNSLAVTGPASGCGKTLTAINLAISLAMEVDRTVLLVDLDLRKPSIHQYFGYEPEFGIADYLLNNVPVNEMMFSPGIDRLVVLPGSVSLHNSSEMLRSPKMLTLVDEIKNRYPERLVVVDLPPVLAADDALAFSPYIDAMLIVAEDGSTRREHLERTLQILKDAPIIGTVLNKTRNTSHTGYGYYSAEPSGKSKKD